MKYTLSSIQGKIFNACVPLIGAFPILAFIFSRLIVYRKIMVELQLIWNPICLESKNKASASPLRQYEHLLGHIFDNKQTNKPFEMWMNVIRLMTLAPRSPFRWVPEEFRGLIADYQLKRWIHLTCWLSLCHSFQPGYTVYPGFTLHIFNVNIFSSPNSESYLTVSFVR